MYLGKYINILTDFDPCSHTRVNATHETQHIYHFLCEAVSTLWFNLQADLDHGPRRVSVFVHAVHRSREWKHPLLKILLLTTNFPPCKSYTFAYILRKNVLPVERFLKDIKKSPFLTLSSSGLLSSFCIPCTYYSLDIGNGVGANFVDQRINNMVDTEDSDNIEKNTV